MNLRIGTRYLVGVGVGVSLDMMRSRLSVEGGLSGYCDRLCLFLRIRDLGKFVFDQFFLHVSTLYVAEDDVERRDLAKSWQC